MIYSSNRKKVSSFEKRVLDKAKTELSPQAQAIAKSNKKLNGSSPDKEIRNFANKYPSIGTKLLMQILKNL